MIGKTILHYEVGEKIGAGGMGVVYRGRDTKLGRDVAIKVLPEAIGQDQGRLSRFRHEAKVLASLNHPNIAQVYGMEESGGVHFLVMELVPGETLAEWLKRGASSREEALQIARQVAVALEAAHEKGIVHRDLKPANIMVTPDGQVKVLDFGLAKVFEDETGDVLDPSSSPTLSAPKTRAGVILGTAAYMSPEQARGQVVDKRSDIFSFGSVLYEMLAGRPAFAGATVSDILAAILKAEPDWKLLPATVGPEIRKLLRRCLKKDRKQRQRDIGDVRLEIQELLAEPVGERVEVAVGFPKPMGWRRTALLLTATSLVVGALVGLVVWSLRPSPRPRVTRFGITVPAVDVRAGQPVLSPDGTSLVYAANGQLYLRAMDQMKATPIRGTEGGIGSAISRSRSPFFSPDGLWLGFVAGGKLRKVSVAGGAPVTLCDAGSLYGASWAPNDTIVFGERAGGIFRVSADGGTPEVLIPKESRGGEMGYHPQVLPDGKAVLFTLATGRNWDEAQIVVQSLETGERRVLVEGGADARYVPTGHLVYAVADTVLAVPFDLSRLEVTGGAVPVVEGVSRNISGWGVGSAAFSFSGNGSLVFVPRAIADERVLVWVDREGAVEPMPAPPRDYSLPRLSPDGERLAVVTAGDVWVYDIPRGASTRLTFDGTNSYVGWMADGQRVAFSSSGKQAVLWRAADGGGAAGQLMTGELYPPHLDSISPDGQFLGFHEHRPATRADVWILPLETDGKPRSFLETPFAEHGTKFAPDGHSVAYVSDESGQDEVYVQPFPGLGGLGAKTLISTEGGNAPVWARSGHELFYFNGDKLMVVDITTDPELEAGDPRLLFEGRFTNFTSLANFDVTPDGRRFVMIQENPELRTQLNVVLNWFDELKRLIPVE